MSSNSRSRVIASLIIIGIVFGAVGGFLYLTNPYEPSRVAVIFMAPGFGDFSVADQIQLGMDELLRYASVSYYFPEELPTTVNQARTIIEDYASRTGFYDVIVVVGAELASALAAVASRYPNQKFVMIDGSVKAPNVASATFETQEAAFLAGVLAAVVADSGDYSGIVGILAAVENDMTLEPIIYGFRQGVLTARDDLGLNITLLDTIYLNGFNDTESATTETIAFFDPFNTNGSVLFAPVRAGLKGVRLGLEYANQTWYSNRRLGDRYPLVIGAEHNVDWYGNPRIGVALGPSWIMTSVVPRTDLAFRSFLNKTLWNEFDTISNEIHEYNLANNGVNITDFQFSIVYLSRIHVAMTEVKHYQTLIINGTIVVGTGP